MSKTGQAIRVGILVVVLAAMYWPTALWMWDRWNGGDGYFSHGPFVPVVAAILIGIKHQRLRRAEPGSVRAGLWLIGTAAAAHLFAVLWGINFLSGLSLLPLFVGMELYFLGGARTRVLLWPTLFLFFMIPLPQVTLSWVATESKFVAADVSVRLLQLVGYEVTGKGSYVYFPKGELLVDEVCSGLKYLFSLIAFGAFYVQLSSLTPPRKLVLFLLAFPLAWLANVVRILTLCVVGYHWGADKALAWYSHDLFGFVMYFLAFILMFMAESGLMIGMEKASPQVGDDD